MYETIILPAAKADIVEAAMWYNEQRKGLGREFTKALREKINLIKNNPASYSLNTIKAELPLLKDFRL